MEVEIGNNGSITLYREGFVKCVLRCKHCGYYVDNFDCPSKQTASGRMESMDTEILEVKIGIGVVSG